MILMLVIGVLAYSHLGGHGNALIIISLVYANLLGI